jgi:hypothetical protein
MDPDGLGSPVDGGFAGSEKTAEDAEDKGVAAPRASWIPTGLDLGWTPRSSRAAGVVDPDGLGSPVDGGFAGSEKTAEDAEDKGVAAPRASWIPVVVR